MKTMKGLVFTLFFAAMFVCCLADQSGAVTAADGFDPNANGNVYFTAIQSDGKIIVGGVFTSIGGQTRNHIARLNKDGSR